jgi:DNA (cytosine-5)-methyltransferase 1
MRELSLFTGAGGGILGSKLLGWKTVGYVEFNDYCQRIIRQRIIDGIFDNAPIFGDIRAFISEGYAESYKGMVDIITGGFPCQPFSVAGKQLAENDERNMWPETIRTIRTIRPKYALFENVAALITSGYFGTILCDIHESGYNARWCVLSGENIGAEHKRERVWIFAYPKCFRLEKQVEGSNKVREIHKFRESGTLSRYIESSRSNKFGSGGLLRMDNDVDYWVDRLKAVGNGQIPVMVRTAWEILSEGII